MNRVFSLVLICMTGLNLVAQDIKLSVEAPAVVAVGEQFMVTWVVNSRGGQFEAPPFSDFYKLMGPQTSFSSSTQIINGKVTSEIRNSFSYYLQATREGKYTIPPALYREKKDEYLSEPVVIEVVNDKTQAVQKQSQQAAGGEGAPSAQSGNDLYIRMLINRNRVYLGEHVVATFKLYSKVNLSGIQDYRFPDFNSFLKEDIETPQPSNLERENVNGEIYGTAVLQRFLLYPQRSGKIEIDPASLTVLVQERQRSNDPFFGDFFSNFNTVPKMLSSLPAEIEVLPLPPGAPPAFSGTVGKLSINADINKDSLSVNEAITYRIVLSGSGNLKLTAAPEINISPDIEVYEPKITTNLKPSISGTSGSKTFEYVLIPRYHGIYTVPSFEFSYFDPDEERYITIRTDEKIFKVSKSSSSENETEVYGGISREDIKYLGKDIRYIKTSGSAFRNQKKILVSGSTLYICFASMIALFALIIIIRREQVKRNADLAKVKNRKAARTASRRLKKASLFLKNNDQQLFYAELLKTLWGYLGDKLNMAVSELTREKALAALAEKGMDDQLVQRTGDLIDRCELTRYSRANEDISAQELYGMAVTVIRDIEDKI